MCNSVALAVMSMAATVGTTVYQSNVQKKIAEHEQDTANKLATDSLVRGANAANIQRDKVRSVLASQRVAAGASGATMDSFTDVFANSAGIGELDARTIEQNAAREAWGYREKASVVGAQNQLNQGMARMKIGGSLLTTASEVYGAKF